MTNKLHAHKIYTHASIFRCVEDSDIKFKDKVNQFKVVALRE